MGLEPRVLADALSIESVINRAEHDDCLGEKVQPEEHDGEEEVGQEVQLIVNM